VKVYIVVSHDNENNVGIDSVFASQELADQCIADRLAFERMRKAMKFIPAYRFEVQVWDVEQEAKP
jgi:hypothetical protein